MIVFLLKKEKMNVVAETFISAGQIGNLLFPDGRPMPFPHRTATEKRRSLLPDNLKSKDRISKVLTGKTKVLTVFSKVLTVFSKVLSVFSVCVKRKSNDAGIRIRPQGCRCGGQCAACSTGGWFIQSSAGIPCPEKGGPARLWLVPG